MFWVIMIWFNWRCRYRPANSGKHGWAFPSHTIIQTTPAPIGHWREGARWYCMNCSHSSEYRPPLGVGGWLYTGASAALTGVALWLGSLLSSVVVGVL